METGTTATTSRVTDPIVLAGPIAGAVGGACVLLLEMLYGAAPAADASGEL